MNEVLSNDEYDALRQITEASPAARPSACVARNLKRLAGLKFVAYSKSGAVQITEKGEQTLFLRRCIDGLRAVSHDPLAKLAEDVQTFLHRKGHLTACTHTGGHLLTARGQESLADIDAAAV